MRSRASLLILALAALALPAAHLRAETDAACCRCDSFYKLSDKGFGFLRHHVGFCPKCTAEMGGDVDAYLERLRGKNRGLADAAQLTLQQIRQSTAARDQARDSIYGRKGLATGFFKSLLSFSAEGANGAFKTVAKNAKKGLDWYNKAADTLGGDFKWVIKEGKGWVEGKTVGAAKDQAALKTAAAMGGRYYQQTGDARGATKQFLDAHADIKKGVSVLESAIDFYEKTSKLADGIQDYLEHRANAARLWNEWNDITDQMEALLKEIARLDQCKELLEKQGKSASLPRRAGPPAGRQVLPADWTVRFASATPLADERAALKALVFPENSPDASALQSALSSLMLLRTGLADFRRTLDEEMLPPLLPFWLDVQAELGRDLAKALLEWAVPVTDDAARQYDRLLRHGEGAAEGVRRAEPKTKTT